MSTPVLGLHCPWGLSGSLPPSGLWPWVCLSLYPSSRLFPSGFYLPASCLRGSRGSGRFLEALLPARPPQPHPCSDAPPSPPASCFSQIPDPRVCSPCPLPRPPSRCHSRVPLPLSFGGAPAPLSPVSPPWKAGGCGSQQRPLWMTAERSIPRSCHRGNHTPAPEIQIRVLLKLLKLIKYYL